MLKQSTRSRRKRLREITKTTGFYTAKDNSGQADSTTSQDNDESSTELLGLLTRKSEHLSQQEADLVCRQLGYIPYNLIEVAASSTSSEGLQIPLALKLYPLTKKEHRKKPANHGSAATKTDSYSPFPTMMWLSCPETYAKISKIELSGWINKFQIRILDSSSEDPSCNWLVQMENAHKQYALERWTALSEEDRAFLEEKGWESNIKDVGIAGIKDFSTVKCLHTHYAHHVARPEHGNVIGKWTEELLQATDQEANTNKKADKPEDSDKSNDNDKDRIKDDKGERND